MGTKKTRAIVSILGLLCLAVSGLLGVCAEVEAQGPMEIGPPVPKEKKLIGFAPDLVDTRYLKNNIGELERIPIDGLFIAVHPDWKKIAEGDLYLGRINLASGPRYKLEDYTQAIANLKETKFNRFTDNFIDFSLCARNAYDWFDERWSTYAHNAGVLAHVAKEGGLKGFWIDIENYGGLTVPVPHPFSYSMRRDLRKDKSERSFDEVAAQVRKRGREFMMAIVAEYPDITIMMHPDMWGSDNPFDLTSAFVDGLLQAGPKATLIDAGGLAYGAMLHENFRDMRQFAQKRGPERSQVPELYKKRMQYAYGLWVDYHADSGFGGGWHTDPKNFDMNYRSPERLEHTLYNALTVSDKYVWLFMIHPQVWWQPDLLKPENVAKQMEYSPGWRCTLCPHSEIPEAYLDAIRNSRKPHDLNWAPERARNLAEAFYQNTPYLLKTIKGPEDLQGKNILKNGGFESWKKGNVPDGWEVTEARTKYVSREDVIVKEGSHSVKVSTKDPARFIYIIQSIPAAQYVGKTITFGVWTKRKFGSESILNVIDCIQTTGRKDHQGAGRIKGYEGKDGWWFVTATKTIRKNAVGNIQFFLDNVLPADGVVYYDGAIAVVVAEEE